MSIESGREKDETQKTPNNGISGNANRKAFKNKPEVASLSTLIKKRRVSMFVNDKPEVVSKS
jgi:hypothetical protein